MQKIQIGFYSLISPSCFKKVNHERDPVTVIVAF